jgi:hypothetical protein
MSSNHSVIEHRANYHYVKLEEDYLAICSTGKQSPHCKALILSILEQWMNTKRTRGESDYVYMTIPQWVKYTYLLYARNTVIDCLAELREEGLIERRPITMYNQETYEYKLKIDAVQARLRALPTKSPKDTLPDLDACLASMERNKVRRAEAKQAKREGSLKINGSGVVEKSTPGVEKSTGVGEKSTGGWLKNQRNLSSRTQLHSASQRESDADKPAGPTGSLETQTALSLDLSSLLAALSEEQRHELLHVLTGGSSVETAVNGAADSSVPAERLDTSSTPSPRSTPTQPPLDGEEEQGQETGEREGQPPVQATVVLPPSMPPQDAPWCPHTCMQLFDAWRGAPLLVSSTRRKAQQAATGLVRHYSREQVVAVYRAMNEDPYWVKQGGVDIEQVANHIARELKKLDQASARSPATSSSPSPGEPSMNPYTARSLDKEHNARQLAKMRAMLEQQQQSTKAK